MLTAPADSPGKIKEHVKTLPVIRTNSQSWVRRAARLLQGEAISEIKWQENINAPALRCGCRNAANSPTGFFFSAKNDNALAKQDRTFLSM